MATTTKGVPYPTPGDPDDVPADLYALAAWVDAQPGIATLTTTARDALAGAELWEGRVIYNDTTNRLEQYDGAAWTPVALSPELLDHLNDTSGAHAASAISYAGAPGLSATDVEAALDQLDTLVTGKAEKTKGGAETATVPAQTTGSVTLNCSAASIFTITPTGNITLAPSNVPATGIGCTLTVRVIQGATPRTVTLPSGGVWMGPQPVQTANKRCVITMITVDGGTTWDCTGVVQS